MNVAAVQALGTVSSPTSSQKMGKSEAGTFASFMGIAPNTAQVSERKEGTVSLLSLLQGMTGEDAQELVEGFTAEEGERNDVLRQLFDALGTDATAILTLIEGALKKLGRQQGGAFLEAQLGLNTMQVSELNPESREQTTEQLMGAIQTFLQAIDRIPATNARTVQPDIQEAMKWIQVIALSLGSEGKRNGGAYDVDQKGGATRRGELSLSSLLLQLMDDGPSKQSPTVSESSEEAVQRAFQARQAFIDRNAVTGQQSEPSETVTKGTVPTMTEDSAPFQQELSQWISIGKEGELQPGKETRPMTLTAFTKQFEQLMERATLLKNGQSTKLLVKLNPEHLGSLRVELLQQNGVVTAKILASTQSAKDSLEGQLHQLKAQFAQANITVEKIEVSHGSASQESGPKQFSQQQEQGKPSTGQPDYERDESKNDNEQVRFDETLEKLLQELEIPW
ncbi:flagellar hook-length control protein FliK [Bacillus fonticola]|uniref:flagellar hook-length control protein FliK n=1 Tax=Bacillus fonticola TaxID=2728853 RepID=UPI00147490F3|nr:flagellar hook-length control protein FliK [Bacillus fonticola]